MLILSDILFYFPELFLLCSTFVVITFIIASTLFSNPKQSRSVKNSSLSTTYRFTCFILIFYFFFLIFQFINYQGPVFLFNHCLVVTYFSLVFKISVVFFSIFFITISLPYFLSVKFDRAEIYVIILFLIFGMVTALDSADFITFYLALELQSLCFYIFIAFNRSSQSVRATLTYFIYSILSSTVLLFGVSLVYYSTGSTNFYDIALLNIANRYLPDETYTFFSKFSGFIVAFAFLFKIGSVPFHFWVPDVYDFGDFFPVSFLGTVSKIFAFGVFFKLSSFLFFFEYSAFSNVLQISGLASIVYGVLGGLVQVNIKRLLGFSSIAHAGYVLLIFSLGTLQGLIYGLFYVFGYILSITSIFVFFLSIFGFSPSNPSLTPLTKLSNLSGMSYFKEFRFISFLLSLNLFSFSGLPPFGGFFIKLFVFYGLIETKLYLVLFVATLFSLLSSYYYIRLITILYFNDDKPSSKYSYRVVSSAGLNIFYFLSFFNVFFLFFTNALFKISFNAAVFLTCYFLLIFITLKFMKPHKLILLRRSPSSIKLYIYRDDKVRGSVVSAQLYKLTPRSSKLGADVIVHFNQKNLKTYFKNSVIIKDFVRQYLKFLEHARTVELSLPYRSKKGLEVGKLFQLG